MYFATFGSGQLQDFDLLQSPTDTLVTIEGASENELREAIFKSPIGSKFCTTYPKEYLKKFKGSKVIELDELMKSYKHKKRYAVTVDLYVYAETDEKAKEEAKFYKEHIQLVADNKANIVSIHEAPFATIGKAREVK